MAAVASLAQQGKNKSVYAYEHRHALWLTGSTGLGWTGWLGWLAYAGRMAVLGWLVRWLAGGLDWSGPGRTGLG